MSLLCEITEFKKALYRASQLLKEEELKLRGLSRIPAGVKICYNFFKNIYMENFNSYEELIRFLQKSKEVIQLSGGLGKLLDVLQILKPDTLRNKKIKEKILISLRRTGHEFIWEELPKLQQQNYEIELVKGTALFHLLETILLYDPTQTTNPINTFRNSMGTRLPEEYFADLLAGWIIEDVFKNFLEKKGFSCSLEGPDKEHKLLFVRPSDMGSYDFKVMRNNKVFFIELQRLGKISRETKNKKKLYYKKIKTYLKKHKYLQGNTKNKILVLWFGKIKQKIYSQWSQKIIFIHNIKNQSDIGFKDNYIYMPTDYLDGSYCWSQLKRKNHLELLQLFEG